MSSMVYVVLRHCPNVDNSLHEVTTLECVTDKLYLAEVRISRELRILRHDPYGSLICVSRPEESDVREYHMGKIDDRLEYFSVEEQEVKDDLAWI